MICQRRTVYLLSACFLVCLLTACATPSDNNTQGKSTTTATGTSLVTTNPTSTPTTAPTSTAAQQPSTCPTAGIVRSAVMNAFTAGTNQNVIYVNNGGAINGTTPGTATLLHYDVATHNKTIISTLDHASISITDISRDGQWIAYVDQLFDTQHGKFGAQQLRLVRVDGQQAQLLACFTNLLMGIAWSPDQKQIALVEQDVNTAADSVSLLDLQHGNIQKMLSAQQKSIYTLNWTNNRYMYIRFAAQENSDPTLYLLDTQKGINQQQSDLKVVFQQTGNSVCWGAAESIDGSALYVSQCTERSIPGGSGAGSGAPSSISIQSSLGGTLQTIANFQQLAVDSVEVVSRTTLIFSVSLPVARNASDPRNGLWKVGTDGSNPVQLTHEEGQLSPEINEYQINASRDGTMYSYRLWDQTSQTATLKYGTLSGGTPEGFVSSNTDSLNIVGWTTL